MQYNIDVEKTDEMDLVHKCVKSCYFSYNCSLLTLFTDKIN